MQPLRESLKQTLGILVEAFAECYLGLPTAIGRITSGTFMHINERSKSKMQGWSERTLACAAREVLLKSIIQAIPTCIQHELLPSFLLGVSVPFTAELLAFREGVIFAQHVNLEVDSMKLVNLWNLCSNSGSIFAPILKELEAVVHSFIYFWVTHVGRNLNLPAHMCAQRVRPTPPRDFILSASSV